MSFPPKFEIFLQIKSEFLNLERFEETGFLKKTLSSFQKTSAANLEGGESAGGSRPSCFKILANRRF